MTSEWTLFLDRDGVINHRLVGNYIKSWSEFKFLPGVLKALQFFALKFKYIIIVTNQAGIGKQYMTIEEVSEIHKNLRKIVRKHRGRIDAIFISPDTSADNSPLRKPNTGMADLAKSKFPLIDFSKSIMVGDSISDIEFGKRKNMKTVFISADKSLNTDINNQFPDLAKFANYLRKNRNILYE